MKGPPPIANPICKIKASQPWLSRAILHLGKVRLPQEWPPNVTSRTTGRFESRTSQSKARCSTDRAMQQSQVLKPENQWLLKICLPVPDDKLWRFSKKELLDNMILPFISFKWIFPIPKCIVYHWGRHRYRDRLDHFDGSVELGNNL